MGIFGSALGGFAGGFLDGDGGVGAANAANAGINAWINSMMRGQMVKNQLGFLEAEKRLRQRADDVMGDFDRSEADVRGMARGSKQAVHDNAKRQTAGASQSLLNRGLLNSSVGASMQRGINADTQRNLSGIDARQAGFLSQLNQNRAGVRAAVEGDFANLPIQQNQMGMNMTSMFANALGQQGHVAQGGSNGFSQLFGAAGSLLPF